jgi:putative FmdB family regulatory protein
MPLYEFRCPNRHDFEKFYRSIGSAPSEEKCPECGLTAVRLMSAAGLVFKGSGFYITDYGKDGKNDLRAATAAADKAAASKENASKDKATADSKSDAKAPAAEGTSTKAAESSTTPTKAPETKPAAPAPSQPAKKAE